MSIDHQATDDVVCPWCGRESTDSYEFFDGVSSNHVSDVECEGCGKFFHIMRDFSVYYYTTKAEASSDPG